MLPNPLLIGTTGDYKPMSFYNKDYSDLLPQINDFLKTYPSL